jgi:hypothetical protein
LTLREERRLKVFKNYCAGDKIQKNERGGACRVYGGGKRRVQGFGGKT